MKHTTNKKRKQNRRKTFKRKTFKRKTFRRGGGKDYESHLAELTAETEKLLKDMEGYEAELEKLRFKDTLIEDDNGTKIRITGSLDGAALMQYDKSFYCGTLQRSLPQGFGVFVEFENNFGEESIFKDIQKYLKRDDYIYKYYGFYKEGLFHGHGTEISKERDNKYTYSGNYKDGKYDGYGIMIYPDDTKYEGNWEKNRPHGPGSITNKEGTFEGNADDGTFTPSNYKTIAGGK
jgi:hypothetical protein